MSVFFIMYNIKSILTICSLFLALSLNAIDVYPTKKFVVLPGTSIGGTSAAVKIDLSINAHAQNLQIATTGSVFELSLDSINYNSVISILPSNAVSALSIYARCKPNVALKVFQEQIYFVHAITDTSANRIELQSSSMPSDSFYTFLTWNIKWMGDPFSCNCDTAYQISNLTKILNEIKPDVAALQEIVKVQRLQSIANNVGTDYKSAYSNYCSFATNTNDVDYADGQKLAYIYNAKLLDTIRTFGLGYSTIQTIGTGSGSPYTDFSSGRFPFVLQCENKQSNEPLSFFNFHAKAGSGLNDYSRRAIQGAYIADSITVQYPLNKILLLGDYNDKLQGSIVGGQSISPYNYMLTHGLNGISLPSLYPNATTYLGFSNSLIDNFSFSDAWINNYVPGSFTIMENLLKAFPDYESDISDHLPALVYVKKSLKTPTGILDKNLSETNTIAVAYYGSFIKLLMPDLPNQKVSIRLFSLNGQEINLPNYKAKDFKLDTNSYPDGLYILEVELNGKVQYLKVQF